jgi:hypothetical protein
MTAIEEVDYILNDCFFAVGQAVGTRKHLEPDAIRWWRDRYRRQFLHVMTVHGNSWALDRNRVTAVGRYLGLRAVHHAGERASIGLDCAELASRDVEQGCHMNAEREGVR